MADAISAPLAGLVLGGAFLHASWNALIKGGQDKLLDTLLVALGGALIGLVCLPFLPLPASAAWPWLAGSVSVHCLYYYLVAQSYRHGDMSLVYPLMRGSAPMVTALLSVLVFGEQVSPGGLLGVGLLSFGILLLAGGHWRSGADRRVLWFGCGNALVIVAYTLFDGHGARASGHALSYTLWLFALDVLPLLLWLGWQRGSQLWSVVWAGRRRLAVGGACSVGSYAIALWAMTQAPIALVAALRETSVIFGLLLGAVLLRERVTLWRGLATAVVCLGALTIRLG